MRSINVVKTSIFFLSVSLIAVLSLEVLFEYLLYSEIKLTLINIYFLLAFISVMSLVFFTIISKMQERQNATLEAVSENLSKDGNAPILDLSNNTFEKNSSEIKVFLTRFYESQDEFLFISDPNNFIKEVFGNYKNVVIDSISENIIGFNIIDILDISADSRENLVKLYKETTAYRNSNLGFEFSVLKNEVECRYFLDEKILYNDEGEVRNIIGVIKNIDEVYELRKKQTVTDELSDAKEKIEQISQLKSSILTNINHELRSPIASILGLTEIILEETHTEGIKEKIIEINKAGLSLLNSINSIINLGLLESSQIKFKIEECDTGNIISDVLSRFIKNRFIEENSVEKDLLLNCSALVDKKLLVNILNNLLENALKYTINGKILIRNENKIDKTGKISYCCITVKDYGAGLNEENKKLLFSDFRTMNDAIGNIHEESGLGLLVAKKMTELMKGKIEVLSTPGLGTEFKIYFPSKISGIEKSKKEEIQNKLLFTKDSLPKVLLVEDNNTNKVITVLFLKELCNIDHAADGNSAIEFATKNKYDLILMDINLGPGINGIEVTSSIRKLPVNNTIPIIAVTGYAMPGDEEKLLHLGFDGYLAKPFTKESITNLIRSYLRIE